MADSALPERTLRIAATISALAIDVQAEVAGEEIQHVRKRIADACQSLTDDVPHLYGWLEQRRPQDVQHFRERLAYVCIQARNRHTELGKILDSSDASASSVAPFEPEPFKLYGIIEDFNHRPRIPFRDLIIRMIEGLRCWANDQQAEATSTAEPVLGENARFALTVLLAEGATNSDKRISTERIAQLAIGKLAGADAFKKVVLELKRAKLVQTEGGRAGGVWLTAEGRRRAERLTQIVPPI